MVLADTNILSTFAKINQVALLFRLLAPDRIGIVSAVYTELSVGVDRGYKDLQAIVDLVRQGQIVLVAPDTDEIMQKAGLPAAFDAGERETLTVARARAYAVLTNENQVKHWCERQRLTYLDLPGILRALWKTKLLSQEQVQSLIEQIETKDKIRFKNQEQIFSDF